MSKQSEQTPPAWKAGNRNYGTGLTLKIAREMLEAGEKEAERQGVPMVIAITDSGGNLLAFIRMDNALLLSINVAMDKAFTAVLSKLPTAPPPGGINPPFIHKRWIQFPGGFPIIKDGVLLGGVGVSGGTVEDLYVARAALAAGGFSLDEVNAVLS